jgi:hypothetical protein
MSLTTPYLISPIKPFSPEKSYDFPFIYSSGEQAVRNNLVIQRLSDNFTVYDETIESFSVKHPVSSNTLQSGFPYKARIRVGSVTNLWSEFSDWVIFWVLEKPVVTIDNIDYENQNRVYNQTVTFSSTYSHSNNESLQSYRYNLYDSSNNLIESYNERFTDGTTSLTQEVAGLVNGELYYIELKTISVNFQEYSTGLILVRPFYVVPATSSAIKVENMPSEGAVKLLANLVQIVGKLYDNNDEIVAAEDIEYVDGEKIDLNRVDYDRVMFEEGFNTLSEEFVLKLWCENIPDDTVFLTMLSNYGRISLTKYDNRIHLFKYTNGVTHPSHYVSEEHNFSNGKQFMIHLVSIASAFDVKVFEV